MKIAKTYIVADVCTEHVVIHFVMGHIREQVEVERVMDEISEVANGFDFKVLVLNFSRIRMLSSSFLGKLIGLRAELNERQIAVRACCMDPDVLAGFRMLNLHKLIKVFPSEEKAVR